jgi:hypothetical protein
MPPCRKRKSSSVIHIDASMHHPSTPRAKSDLQIIWRNRAKFFPVPTTTVTVKEKPILRAAAVSVTIEQLADVRTPHLFTSI